MDLGGVPAACNRLQRANRSGHIAPAPATPASAPMPMSTDPRCSTFVATNRHRGVILQRVTRGPRLAFVVASIAAMCTGCGLGSGLAFGEDSNIGTQPRGPLPQPGPATPITQEGGLLGSNGILGTNSDLMPGSPYRSGGRQVVVSGEVDLSASRRYNASDANSDHSDAYTYSPIRARMGFEVRADQDVKVGVAFGWHGIAGNRADNPQDPNYAVNNGPDAAGNKGQVELLRADIRIDSFMGFDTAGLLVGRSGVSTAISDGRRKDSSLLFDSRADNRDQSGWDGARLHYDGFEPIVVKLSAYKLPDQSDWLSARVEWAPPQAGDERFFIAGSYNVQKHVPIAGGLTAKDLTSIYVGTQWNLANVELWGEGALQSGTTSDELDINSWGFSSGIDWHWNVPTRLGLGLGFDWLSGDKPGGKFTGFINPYETIHDTYLFESETYGELLRNRVGNVQAIKARFGYAFNQQDTVGIDFTWGNYSALETTGKKSLGDEFDLTLRWKYQNNTDLRFFAGMVLPGDALKASLSNNDDKKDQIFLIGGSLTATF